MPNHVYALCIGLGNGGHVIEDGGLSKAIPRQDGVRAAVAAIRSGVPFYYAPDLDFGRKDAVFVPFFGVPAATITGLPLFWASDCKNDMGICPPLVTI